MGDVYGAGLLAVAPLGLSDDDALGYLRQFAGLGLSRRFVEVLPSRSVIEFVVQGGVVERTLDGASAALVLRAYDAIGGSAPYAFFQFVDEAIHLAGWRGRGRSTVELRSSPFHGQLVQGLGRARTNCARIGRTFDETPLMRDFYTRLARDFALAQRHRLSIHLGRWEPPPPPPPSSPEPALLDGPWDLPWIRPDVMAPPSELGALLLLRSGAEVTETLARGGDPNERNSHGWTLLMRAAHFSEPEVLEALIAGGAALDRRNIVGETAVFLAAERGRRDIVELLLRAGADPRVPSGGATGASKRLGIGDVKPAGTLPEQCAADHGHDAIASRLAQRRRQLEDS